MTFKVEKIIPNAGYCFPLQEVPIKGLTTNKLPVKTRQCGCLPHQDPTKQNSHFSAMSSSLHALSSPKDEMTDSLPQVHQQEDAGSDSNMSGHDKQAQIAERGKRLKGKQKK